MPAKNIDLTQSTRPVPDSAPSKLRVHFLKHQDDHVTIKLTHAQACVLWDLVATAQDKYLTDPASTKNTRSAVRMMQRLAKWLPRCYSTMDSADIFEVSGGEIVINDLPADVAEFIDP